MATVHPENAAGIRVLEKAGLRYEGRLRDHYRVPGGWRDSLLYAVLSTDTDPGLKPPGPPLGPVLRQASVRTTVTTLPKIVTSSAPSKTMGS